MPRNSRVVAVGYPHHITQRGNNRELVFFDDEDRWAYLDLLSHYTQRYRVDIWAYCLMTNHIHLLAAPDEPDGLARGVGLANMTYTQHINCKYNRSGRIWQNRFWDHLIRDQDDMNRHTDYIHFNPVKHGIVANVSDWPW